MRGPAETIRDRRTAALRSLKLAAITARNDTRSQADLEVALRDYSERVAQDEAVRAAVAREEGSPYRPDTRWSFFGDMASSGVDRGARSRLEEHVRACNDRAAMEARSTTSSLGGLVPPAYLLELLAAGPRNDRPVADLLSTELTTTGMEVDLARVSTSASAEAQGTENTALTGTTPATTLVTVPVRTIAIRSLVSFQMLARASAGWDLLYARELLGAHGSLVERYLLNGSGSAGQPTGLLGTSGVSSVTYTSSSATLAEFLGKVAAAITTATANRGMAPDTLVVHPRRWAYVTSRSEAATDAGIGGPRPGSPASVVGTCLGLDVVASAGMPTTLSSDQDAALVFRRSDVYFGETGVQVHLDTDTSSGSSTTAAFRAYTYVALDATRYASSLVKVTGTGMAAVAS